MRLIKSATTALFWGAVILFATSCGREEAKPLQPETIKIGAVYPFSGHSGATGKEIKVALDLACEIINQSSSLPLPLARDKGLPTHGNAPVQIIYKDSHSDETQAQALVEALVLNDQVAAVMGCYNSAVTAVASEQAEALKIPFLNAESTSPLLTKRGLRWFFRTTPDDSIFAQNFFTFFAELKTKLNIEPPKRLLTVYENRLWGTSVARAERKLALKHEYQLVQDIPYDANAEDVDSELRQIESAMPGVILQSSYADDAVRFIQGYKQKDINPTAILGMNAGFISPSFIQKLGRDSEYILSREVWALDIGRHKPLVKQVNDLFFQKHGANMTGNSARAFTGLMVLADALNRAQTLDPDDIRKALMETELTGEQLIMPWDGVKFDIETGQNILGRGIIVQIRDGDYRTVWPWELSEGKVIWPMPSWSERTVGDPK